MKTKRASSSWVDDCEEARDSASKVQPLAGHHMVQVESDEWCDSPYGAPVGTGDMAWSPCHEDLCGDLPGHGGPPPGSDHKGGDRSRSKEREEI